VSTIVVGGEALTLLPEKAVWIAAERTLLVADAHVGKAVTFRRLGVPVPRGTTTATLDLLGALVARHGARRIVFLGDLLHSAHARAAATVAAVERWRDAHADLALTLVRGNHDSRAGDPPPRWGIEVVDAPLVLGGLRLAHHPRADAGGYVLAGHLHPCIALSGRAHDRLRLPCFWFGKAVGVLPAFGTFTGMHPIRPDSGDRVFAIADDRVAEVALARAVPAE
jgi:DNA ligase-associated metallophosphoesterase